jgi:hypothetical protein
MPGIRARAAYVMGLMKILLPPRFELRTSSGVQYILPLDCICFNKLNMAGKSQLDEKSGKNHFATTTQRQSTTLGLYVIN